MGSAPSKISSESVSKIAETLAGEIKAHGFTPFIGYGIDAGTEPEPTHHTVLLTEVFEVQGKGKKDHYVLFCDTNPLNKKDERIQHLSAYLDEHYPGASITDIDPKELREAKLQSTMFRVDKLEHMIETTIMRYEQLKDRYDRIPYNPLSHMPDPKAMLPLPQLKVSNTQPLGLQLSVNEFSSLKKLITTSIYKIEPDIRVQ